MVRSFNKYEIVPEIDMESGMPELSTRSNNDADLSQVLEVGVPSKMAEAAQLLESLTLQQKIRLLSGRDLWHLKAIPQFNLPSILITDGPHGVRKQEGTDRSEERRVGKEC